jgi:hypothetical protein
MDKDMTRLDTLCVIMGTLTSIGIGGLLMQALGAFIVGILGALGTWIFVRYIKPALENLAEKITRKKTADKA